MYLFDGVTMGLLEDIMKTLERIPAWKRLQDMPEQVARLEQRIAELEGHIKPGGAKCPKCGALTMRLQDSREHPIFQGSGLLIDRMQCSNCQHTEERTRDTMAP